MVIQLHRPPNVFENWVPGPYKELLVTYNHSPLQSVGRLTVCSIDFHGVSLHTCHHLSIGDKDMVPHSRNMGNMVKPSAILPGSPIHMHARFGQVCMCFQWGEENNLHKKSMGSAFVSGP